MTAVARRPFGKVEMSPDRRRYEIRAGGEGWFLFQDLMDEYDRGNLLWSLIPPNSTIQFADAAMSAVVFTKREKLRGVFLRPQIGTISGTPAIVVNGTPTGEPPVPEEGGGVADASAEYMDEDGDWVASETETVAEGVKDDPGLVERAHFGGSVEPATEPAKFLRQTLDIHPDDHLCPNLWFLAGFRRASISEQSVADFQRVAATKGPYQDFATNIFFGGVAPHFRWCLSIPLQGQPTLWASYVSTAGRQLWQQVNWTEGSLREVSARSGALEDHEYSIGVLGDCLCVSEDCFQSDNYAYYQVTNIGQPVIPSGDVRLTNWPGQCQLWFAPLTFGSATAAASEWRKVQSPGIWTGNYVRERVHNFIYGYSPSSLDATSEVWGDMPSWWAAIEGEWWTVDVGGLPSGPTGPPYWPPYGPPPASTEPDSNPEPGMGPNPRRRQWPVYPPPGWPQAMAWPPPYDVPVGVAHTVTGGGGGVTLRHWAVGEADGHGAGYSGYGDNWFSYPYVGWELEIQPAVHGSGLNTYSTPFVESVSLWQDAYMVDNGDPQWTNAPWLYGLTVADELGKGASIQASCELDNREATGQAASVAAIVPGYQVRTRMGWVMSDHSLFDCDAGSYIVASVNRGTERAPVQFADILGMLALVQWDSDDADFRLWNSSTASGSTPGAVAWLLNWAGIPAASYDLEDIGAILPFASWGSTDWRFQDKQLLDMIADILWRGQHHAALWYDIATNTVRSGCPYCRAKRTAENWQTHCDNGWNSTGCVAADAARSPAVTTTGLAKPAGVDVLLAASQVFIGDRPLTAIFQPGGTTEHGALSRENYANRITVFGQAPDGQEIGVSWVNQAAIAPDTAITNEYLGYVVSKVVRDQSLRDYGALNLRLDELKQQAQESCFRLSGAKTALQVFDPAAPKLLRAGHVVMIYGGVAQRLHGIKLRVEHVDHDPKTNATTFTAREMRGPNG